MSNFSSKPKSPADLPAAEPAPSAPAPATEGAAAPTNPHIALVEAHNSLADHYRRLVQSHNQLMESHNRLLDRMAQLEARTAQLEAQMTQWAKEHPAAQEVVPPDDRKVQAPPAPERPAPLYARGLADGVFTHVRSMPSELSTYVLQPEANDPTQATVTYRPERTLLSSHLRDPRAAFSPARGFRCEDFSVIAPSEVEVLTDGTATFRSGQWILDTPIALRLIGITPIDPSAAQ